MKNQNDRSKNVDEVVAAEKAAASEVVVTKVLALVNENAALTSALSYLRRRDFQVKLVHSLMDGISELTNFKPDILLLSWNLKGTDIKKVHPVLTNKFNSICFVVGEDDSTKTTLAILSSGLPNTILYPVTGVNLYTRIQTALGRSNSKNKDPKKRTRTKDKAILGGVEYKRPKKSDIPLETVWAVRVHSPNPANQVWETILYKSGKPQYYYYKGDNPPDKWLAGKDEGTADRAYSFVSDVAASGELLTSFADYSDSGVLEVESDDSEALEEISESAEAKKVSADGIISGKSPSRRELKLAEEAKSSQELVSKVSADRAALLKMKNGLKSGEPIQDNSEGLDAKNSLKRTQTLLEKSVNIAIEMAMKSEIQSFEAPILVDEVSNLTVSVIKSSRFKGYLVSGQATDVSNPNFMKKVFQNLNDEMRKQNEALSTLCGVLELKLGTVPFKKWTQERAEFSIQSKIGNEEIIFAFVPVDELPQNFIDEDLVPISIDKFEENKILYFDLFLHMPANEKHILYLKNGSVFSKISRDRLKEHNTKVLYVKKTDEHLYFAYTARNVFEITPVNREIPLDALTKKLA